MHDHKAHAGRVRFVATFRRERERLNGEAGVIGGGGVAREELNVIVRERGEERREEKGRRKEKKKVAKGLPCSGQATPKVQFFVFF